VVCAPISKVGATARLGATEEFLTHDYIPRDQLDDLADLMDDHLNNALDGIFTDDSDSCLSCFGYDW
jgi:hypothetical protein